MPPTSSSPSTDPQWTKQDSAELSTAMARILVDHRQEIYKWPAFQGRWTNQRADKILFSKLKQFARDGLVKPFGGEMPAGPRGGASGSGRAKKQESDDEFDKKKMVLRGGGVRKREERKVKLTRDSLFDGDSDGEADSESEEGSPSPRTSKRSTRQLATTPATPRPKARPSVPSSFASASRRAIRGGSPEIITIDDSSDEGDSRNVSSTAPTASRPLMLLDRDGRHHHRGHSHHDDDDIETTSDGDGDSPGPLLLTPSQGDSSSPTMDQWRSRVLYSGDSSSQSPSQSRQTPTKKRPASSSSARAGGSSGGGASSSMQPPSSRLKRLKIPAPASGFDRRDYETSPTANRQQRGAAAQAATRLHETRWAFPTEASDWEEEEEEEERERDEREGVVEQEGARQEEEEEQLEEDELEEDRSLVKSASRRSEMLAALFPSDHDDELEV